MTIANYSDLSAAINRWLKRSDTTDQVNEYISFTEDKLISGFNDPQMPLDALDIDDLYTSGNLLLTGGNDSVALPAGFIQFKSQLYIDGSPKYPLNLLSLSNLRSLYVGSVSGMPANYAIAGGNLIVAPLPDSNKTIPYLAKMFNRLSIGNPENVVLLKFPSIYLYGGCMEGSIYARRDDDVLKFYRLFRAAVEAANKQNRDAMVSGSLLMARSDVGAP